jgi:acetyl-CoA decarbonylase/synthase complex subunit gamma
MALASGKGELSACPYLSEEVKEKLSEASAPPIRPLSVGVGDSALKIGGETVQFRHEKRFENPPGLGILIKDTMNESEIDARINKLKEFQYERVGLILKPDLAALKNESGDVSKFEELVNKVKGSNGSGMVLMSENPKVLARAVEACADSRPLIYAATRETAEELGNLAKEKNCPLAARAESLEELAGLTKKLTELGVKDIVIDSGARTMRKAYEDQIIIRRSALERKFKPLGFPTIIFPCEMADNLMKETLIASTFIAKYAGIIVLSNFEGHSLFPLLVERMNIFTDPQRPMATPEGIYPINDPQEDSPVLITVNFSLTYFIVSGEIESSKVPSWLLIMDTEGLSVMTAWAAGKFVGDAVGIFMKKSGIMDNVKKKRVIIPGYAAAISGDLEEELGDWEVKVGPKDASHIPAYLKSGNWK